MTQKEINKLEGQLELLERLRFIKVDFYSVKEWGREKNYYLSKGFIDTMKSRIEAALEDALPEKLKPKK